MDTTALIGSIGKSIADPSVVKLFAELAIKPPGRSSQDVSLYLDVKALGFAIEVEEGDFAEEGHAIKVHGARFIVAGIQFASGEYGSGYKEFSAHLPEGLVWGESFDQARAKLGPESDQDLDGRRQTVYWRKRAGYDLVGHFSKQNGRLELVFFGLANMLFEPD